MSFWLSVAIGARASSGVEWNWVSEVRTCHNCQLTWSLKSAGLTYEGQHEIGQHARKHQNHKHWDLAEVVVVCCPCSSNMNQIIFSVVLKEPNRQSRGKNKESEQMTYPAPPGARVPFHMGTLSHQSRFARNRDIGSTKGRIVPSLMKRNVFMLSVAITTTGTLEREQSVIQARSSSR